MKVCPAHWAQLSAQLLAHGVVTVKVESQPQMQQSTGETVQANAAMLTANLLIIKSAMCVEGIRMINKQGCPICELKVEHWLPLIASRVSEQINHPLSHPQPYSE